MRDSPHIAVVGARAATPAQEIAFARKTGKPVVGLDSWELDGVEAFGAPSAAVAALLHRLG